MLRFSNIREHKKNESVIQRYTLHLYLYTLFNLRVLDFPTIIPRIQKLNFQTSGIPEHPIFIPNSSIFYIRYISPFNHNISIHISCDNIPRQFNTDKEGVCALCRAWKIFQSVEKNANRGGGTVWTGLPAPRIWRCWGQQEEEGEAGEGGSAEGAY